VLPIPGHEDQHLAFHDSATGILLSGDSLYPGLLLVNDWPAYRDSAQQIASFADTHDVSFVLGAHVEMTRSGDLFPIGTIFQPDEHPLQLCRGISTRGRRRATSSASLHVLAIIALRAL
jgi:hydroxyacylglutathione hydrolase